MSDGHLASTRHTGWWQPTVEIGCGALILMLPAFFNGYPFVYSDTATYLSSGFELETPFDRPITYGLFVRITSLNGLSLWSVITAQCLLVSWLLGSLARAMVGRWNLIAHFTLMTTLTLLTSVGWVSCQIMPDIFTAALVLSAILIITDSTQGRQKVSQYAAFVLSCAMHLSHVTLSVVVLLPLLILAIVMRRGVPASIKPRPVLFLLLLGASTVLSMGSALSKSRSVYFMGAMAEHGILKAYLDDHCPGDLRLCALKDSLPERAFDFIWGLSSPVERIGGWKMANEEFARIIPETFTKQKYIWLHVKAAVVATGDQLVRFGIGDGWGAFGPGTSVSTRVEKYFSEAPEAFSSARQQTSGLSIIKPINWVHLVATLAASVYIVLQLLRLGMEPTRQRWIAAILLFTIVCNAFVCGTFANAIDRLGAKVMWLIPAAAFLFGWARLALVRPKQEP